MNEFHAGGIQRVRLADLFLVFSFCLSFSCALDAGPGKSTLVGVVTWKGTPGKPKPLDLSKDPGCAKMRLADPLFSESVVAGPGGTLANVVVYISAGDADSLSAPPVAVTFDVRGCRYTTHVLAVQTGQEIRISNSDPVQHSIHPVAKVNREWNHIQPPGTPPFSYSYEKEEFIPVKCNIHPWEQAYFAILHTGHFSVTAENGLFRLQDLPAGKYHLTAWHEWLGTLSQEVTLAEGETRSAFFAFPAQPIDTPGNATH